MLSYKKPTIWVIAGAVLLCIVLAIGFLTNPRKEKNSEEDLLQNTSGEVQPSEQNPDGEDATKEETEEESYVKRITAHTLHAMRTIFWDMHGEADFSNYKLSESLASTGWGEGQTGFHRHWRLSIEECNAMLDWVNKLEGRIKPVLVGIDFEYSNNGYYTFSIHYNRLTTTSFRYIEMGKNQYIVTENGTFQLTERIDFPISISETGTFTISDLKYQIRYDNLALLNNFENFDRIETGSSWTLPIGDSYLFCIEGVDKAASKRKMYLLSIRDMSYSLEISESTTVDEVDAFVAKTADLPVSSSGHT